MSPKVSDNLGAQLSHFRRRHTIGFLGPLSGPAAGWGVTYETGIKWAAEKINEAGGFKVGHDTYMIKVISCDTEYTGSVAGECAARLVYDEDIHYVIGPLSEASMLAVRDTWNEHKVISTDTGWFVGYGSQYPYHCHGWPIGWHGVWNRAFIRMVVQHYPEIKSEALIEQAWMADKWLVTSQQVADELGLTVVDAVTYEWGTTDFYPILTSIVAKNPDAINMGASAPGDIALMIKQARELGYEGIMLAPNAVPPDYLIGIAGVKSAEGFLHNLADYGSPVWPEATRALYEDHVKRYPDIAMYTTNVSGYVTVNLYVKAIQQAGTTDTDAVRAVFDGPDFTFDFLGMGEVKFCGEGFYGIARVFPFPQALSVIRNGELVQLDWVWAVAP